MSTPGQNGDKTAQHAPPRGVVTVDLRVRFAPTTAGAGSVPVHRRLRDALATPGGRCLLVTLDETADGLDDAAVLAVADASLPVVVALTGAVDGHAAALALAADLRVAADDASVRVEPLMGATSLTLPRVVGEATARLLLLAPRPVAAADALHLGLVHEVHEGDHVVPAAESLACAVADRAGRGAAVRRALSPDGTGARVAQALENEARLRGVVALHRQD